MNKNKKHNLDKLEINDGDIFKLGDHYLVCGSSLDKDLVIKVMRLCGGEISLICSDPPYGVDYVSSKQSLLGGKAGHQGNVGANSASNENGTTSSNISRAKDIVGDSLTSDEAYQDFITIMLSAIKPHLAKKNTYYIFNSDKMVVPLIGGIRGSGFKFTQLLIWVKSNPVVGRLDYLPMHELIAYGWHGSHRFYKSKDKSVIYEPKTTSSKMHPTTKPLALIRRLILNSSKLGDVVFDGFLGSGTTLLASEQTGRVCVGFEIDSDYCRVILKRFAKLSPAKGITLVVGSGEDHKAPIASSSSSIGVGDQKLVE